MILSITKSACVFERELSFAREAMNLKITYILKIFPPIPALSSGAGNANPPGTPEFTLSVSGIRASLLFLIFLMTIQLFGLYTSGLLNAMI